jgi:GNAT superfamily N-acetyltransferase
MPFVVEPLVESDALDLTIVEYRAFSPHLSMFWNSEPSAERFKEMAKFRKSGLKTPGAYFFKAVDTDTKLVVGTAYWKVFKETPTKEQADSSLQRRGNDPERNDAAIEDFRKGIRAARLEIMALEPCVMLGALVVLPEHQKKGAGRLLMQWGLDQMDA